MLIPLPAYHVLPTYSSWLLQETNFGQAGAYLPVCQSARANDKMMGNGKWEREAGAQLVRQRLRVRLEPVWLFRIVLLPHSCHVV